MGQRLNIEIRSDKGLLANAYYHWSGYTSSSAELTGIIIKEHPELLGEIQEDNKVLYAISLLESTNARLTSDEVAYIANELGIDKTFHTATSRNDGLIAVSSKGMEETQRWEVARVEINIDSKLAKFDALNHYSVEHYQEYYEEKVEDLPEWSFGHKPEEVPLDKIADLSTYISEAIKAGNYALKLTEGDNTSVISFIE
ncbi:hypothetical protein [Bacillus atrophaeus]|uniref:hypothetical protein n=1 Tax=Bacillus atrophaeus TaxID=1452 RepID=UPI002E1D8DB9|nr:hypothetical protein [Bacillus atrophaeus]